MVVLFDLIWGPNIVFISGPPLNYVDSFYLLYSGVFLMLYLNKFNEIDTNFVPCFLNSATQTENCLFDTYFYFFDRICYRLEIFIDLADFILLFTNF